MSKYNQSAHRKGDVVTGSRSMTGTIKAAASKVGIGSYARDIELPAEGEALKAKQRHAEATKQAVGTLRDMMRGKDITKRK